MKYWMYCIIKHHQFLKIYMNRKENSIIMGKFILSNGTPLTVKNNESVWYTNPIKKLNIFFKNDEMPYCRIVRINFPFYRYIKCGYFTNGSTKLTTLGTFNQ